MTNNVDKYKFEPTKFSGYFTPDLKNLGASFPTNNRQRAKPNYTSRVVYADQEGEIIQWRVMITDLGGGVGTTNGQFETLHDTYTGFTSSDATNLRGNLDTRIYGVACLPLAATSSGSIDPDFEQMFACNCFNKLYFAFAGGEVIYTETSTTNPALTALSYNPTGSATITGLYVVKVGTDLTPKIAVCLNGEPTQIINADGSVYATMHTSTDDSFGLIQTPTLTPDHPEPILIYAVHTLSTLDSDEAATAAPTAVLTSIPTGGKALGLAKVGGGDYRAYWLWPKDDGTSGGGQGVNVFAGFNNHYGTVAPMRLVSTNLEGTEMQDVPLGLPYVANAIIINDSIIVATDARRIVMYDGRTSAQDLHWENTSFPDSDHEHWCLALINNSPEVLVVNQAYETVGAFVSHYLRLDGYDLTTGKWHVVGYLSGQNSDSTLGDITSVISEASRNLYIADESVIYTVNIPPYGQSIYSNYRQTSSSTSGLVTDATAFTLLPAWELPGLEGWPKTVERLIFLGDVDSGGTDASIQYFIFPPGTTKDYATTITTLSSTTDIPSVTVTAGLEGRAHKVDWTDKGFIYKLQVGIKATRTAADTKKNVNALPFILEGYCYVSRPQPPIGFLTDVQ